MSLKDKASVCTCKCENGMGLRKTILESLGLHYNSSFKCQLWFMACHSEATKACSQNWPAVRTGLTETRNILTCLSACLDPATDRGADNDGQFLAHYFYRIAWAVTVQRWRHPEPHEDFPGAVIWTQPHVLNERDLLDCGPHSPACFLQDLQYIGWDFGFPPVK